MTLLRQLINTLFIVILVGALFLPGLPALANSTLPPLQTNPSLNPIHPLDSLINPDGSLKTESDFKGTVDVTGWQLAFSPQGELRFVRAGSKLEDNLLSPALRPKTAPVTGLYAAGQFTVAGGTIPANRVAFWNNNTWSNLPGSNGGYGVNGLIRTMAISGNFVYVGGNFSEANTGGAAIPANFVARWDSSTNTWSNLPGSEGGNGVNGEVLSLAVAGNFVYVGGNFSEASTGGAAIPVSNIARWDSSSNTWSGLDGPSGGNGVNGTVAALAVRDNFIYVAGLFSQANVGGTAISANNIARWNSSTSTWSNLPGPGGGNGTSSTISALAVSGNFIYVGGSFGLVNQGGIPVLARNVARWDSSNNTWSKLSGPGGGNGVDRFFVYALAVKDNFVYVGGNFTSANVDGIAVPANSIARWNSSNNTWSNLPGPGGGNGIVGYVFSLAFNGNFLYVGGFLTQANLGGTPVNANFLVRWDSSANTWSTVPGAGNSNGVGGSVYDLEFGSFTPPSNLSLTKKVTPSIAQSGALVTYTLAFSNSGERTATGVVLTDLIPISLTQASITTAGGVVVTDTGTSPAYTWQVQDLASGQGGVITLTGQISPNLTSSGRFTNTATIAGTAAESSIANNMAQAGLEVKVPKLAFSSSTYNVSEEELQAVITVTLAPPPLTEVSVDYNTSGGTAQAGSDYTSSSGSLTFISGATLVTFTIPLSDDRIDENDETIELNLSNPSGASLPQEPAALTLVDNDTAGLKLSTTSLHVAEGSSTDTYTVQLNSVPISPLTLTFNTGSQLEALTNLIFPADVTALEPHTVTVTARDDTLIEGDHSQLVSHSAISLDPNYNGLVIPNITSLITDNDLSYTVNAGLAYLNEGNSDVKLISYTIQRSGAITSGASEISFALSGEATAETDYSNVSPEPGALTFDPGEVSQTVTTEVIGDLIAEPDESLTLTLSNPMGSGHALLLVDSATLTILNDDNPGITVSAPSSLITAEAGGSVTFSIALKTIPTAPVTLSLSSGDPTEGIASPTLLVFNNANWNLSQTVTITGQDDLVDDGDVIYNLLFSPAASTDPNYGGLHPDPLTLTNLDDDTARLLLPAPLTLTEGLTSSYTLRLASQPTAPVVVNLKADDQTSINLTKVIFTPLAWNQPQTITITAIDDGLREGFHTSTISHTLSSFDPVYANLGTLPLTVELVESVVVPPEHILFLPWVSSE